MILYFNGGGGRGDISLIKEGGQYLFHRGRGCMACRSGGNKTRWGKARTGGGGGGVRWRGRGGEDCGERMEGQGPSQQKQ